MSQIPLENWSRDYVLAPEIEVNRHRGDRALLDEAAYAKLRCRLGEPIVGYVGGLHYHFAPSNEVLADRAAVPRRNHKAESDRMSLLLAK